MKKLTEYSDRGDCEMRGKTINSLLLVFTALIWGSAFVAQSVGMDYTGPFTFNSVRSLLGGLVLLPVIGVMRRRNMGSGKKASDGAGRKVLIAGGLCCGVLLAAASSLQQIGIKYTTAGKAGFITTLYILIVPVFGLFLGKKAGARTWLGVALAVAGMYFLCITEGFSISKGDFYVLLCAVLFSGHILLIDYFSPRTDGVCLSCIQFFVCALLCAVPAAIFEHPQAAAVLDAWLPLIYAGVLSCGVGYTLQVIAQKNTDPAVASLLLSLESVFSVIAGGIILGERLSARETLGCVLVFAAVILAQLPERSGGACRAACEGEEDSA